MYDLPDAPWVRDAEMNGVPEEEYYTCPNCGEEAPDEIYLIGGQAIGCCKCVKAVDGWVWAEKQREDCNE